MISTSPLSIRTPTTYYRGYTYFWHENGIKLPLRGEATKHFTNEEEAKAYIDSRTSKTQETKPSSAVAPGVMSGAVANWIGGLPTWLIGLFGLVFTFLIVSLFFIWLVTESSTFHCNNIGFDFGNVPIGDCAKFDG
jgi:hypothetical protein